jgi:hypothetical protein
VAREIGVPGSERGGARWSLDHLFLDQDGIPTVVEVKRSSDTRIRREVVGQMLDYAANGVRYWPIDELREAFEITHGGEAAAHAVLVELVDDDADPDAFWDLVEDNLRSGRVRMLFVADEIPPELQTIIEYLNEQMDSAEVLGVEIKQYTSDTLQTLVPRVIGLTATAQRKQRSGPSASHEELLEGASSATRELATRIPSLASDNGCRMSKTKTALKVSHTSGRTLMLLYPQWNTVEFYLSHIWDAGLMQDAADLYSRFSELQGEPLTERHPYLTSEAVLDMWETFAGDLFPRYIQAHERSLESAL